MDTVKSENVVSLVPAAPVHQDHDARAAVALPGAHARPLQQPLRRQRRGGRRSLLVEGSSASEQRRPVPQQTCWRANVRTHAESELFALKDQRTGSPRRLSPPRPVPDRRQQAPLEDVQGLHIRLTRLPLPQRFIPSPLPPAYPLERSAERVEMARREPMSSADPAEGSFRWTSTVRRCQAPSFSDSPAIAIRGLSHGEGLRVRRRHHGAASQIRERRIFFY